MNTSISYVDYTVRMSQILLTASAISAERKESSWTPLLCAPLKVSDTEALIDGIQSLISSALAGSVSGAVTPTMWAMITDAQAASSLLEKAQKAESLYSHYVQASEYRSAANRKLAEAASWAL